MVGIQLMVPKPPKDYRFMKWNWPLIRKTCFWTLMSILAGCTALVIGVIATMARKYVQCTLSYLRIPLKNLRGK